MKEELRKQLVLWMDIWNVLILLTSVLKRELFAQIGVVKMVSAQGEFAIAMLAFMVMIAAKQHALQANTTINLRKLVWAVAHQEPMKTNSHVPVFLVILPALSAGMNRWFVLDVCQHLKIHYTSMKQHLSVWVNVRQTPIKMLIIARIVTRVWIVLLALTKTIIVQPASIILFLKIQIMESVSQHVQVRTVYTMLWTLNVLTLV